MAYIGVLSSTTSSVKVRIYGLDSAYAGSDRVCTWYLDGRRDGTSRLGAKVSSGGDYTFTGLDPGTSYDVLVSITAPGWTITVELDTTVETDAPAVEPWSWSNSNGSASASQTRAAYNAIRSNGSLDNFSYLVWNDMVDKVKEVLDATGDSWNNRYASYSATKMSSSDKRLTATRFNSLRHNIGTHYSTGITDVYRGDTIYGWYFTTLANCLNSWIG